MRITKRRGYIMAVILAIICVVYYHVDPSRYALAPKCVFKLITGLDCPGCGFQRALHEFLHGNFRKAIGYNPFLLVGISTIGFWTLGQFFMQKTSDLNVRQGWARLNKGVVYLYILCYFSWFVLRNTFK